MYYFKDNVDTGVRTWVEDGGATFDQSVKYDTVRLFDANAYTENIRTDDVVAISRHVVLPEDSLINNLTGESITLLDMSTAEVG